jgi:hypothetical protein
VSRIAPLTVSPIVSPSPISLTVHLHQAIRRSVFGVYVVTLAIFPGFLVEDITSSVMGDWYPILLMATFNAMDVVGKFMPIHPRLREDSSFLLRTVLCRFEPALGFQQREWGAAERRHPTGRETMGSSTLQTLQEPILLTLPVVQGVFCAGVWSVRVGPERGASVGGCRRQVR